MNVVFMMANSTGPDVLLRSLAYHRGLHYSLNYKLFGGAVPRPFCGRICVCVWHGILEQ